MGSHQRFQRFTLRRQNNHRIGGQPGHRKLPPQLPIRDATSPPIRLPCFVTASGPASSYLRIRQSPNFRSAVLVFGHAHGRSPAWRSSAPTIAPRVSATFSQRRGLRRLLGEDSLERRVHLPPLSGGGRAVPLLSFDRSPC